MATNPKFLLICCWLVSIEVPKTTNTFGHWTSTSTNELYRVNVNPRFGFRTPRQRQGGTWNGGYIFLEFHGYSNKAFSLVETLFFLSFNYSQRYPPPKQDGQKICRLCHCISWSQAHGPRCRKTRRSWSRATENICECWLLLQPRPWGVMY